MEIGGLFLRTDRQQAAIVLILSTDVYTAHKVKTLNLAFDIRKTLDFSSVVFFFSTLGGMLSGLVFPTCGFIFIIIGCWCFVYELLSNKFTHLVRLITYRKNVQKRFLKDAFFPFCELCKEFVLQCTQMNKHWK